MGEKFKTIIPDTRINDVAFDGMFSEVFELIQNVRGCSIQITPTNNATTIVASYELWVNTDVTQPYTFLEDSNVVVAAGSTHIWVVSKAHFNRIKIKLNYTSGDFNIVASASSRYI